jgi:hypothetical protein
MTQLHPKHPTQESKEDITISQREEKRFSCTASLPYCTYSQWSSYQELVVASQEVWHQLQPRILAAHHHEWTSGLGEHGLLYYDKVLLEKASIHSSNVNIPKVIRVPFYNTAFQALHPQWSHNYCA